jgi:hypothetical protein
MSISPLQHPASSGRASLLVPLALLVGYAALHVAARFLASSNLAEMDPVIELQARAFLWVYVPGEAPLYTWIIHALERVLGPGLAAFQLVKYACVVLTGLGLYAVAQRLTGGDRLWSLLAIEALALIYQLSWRLHEGFASELLAFVAVPFVTLTILRLSEGERIGDYVALGLAVALTLESTGPARLWLVAILAAALVQPVFRRALLRPGLILAVLVALPAALHVAAIDPIWRDGVVRESVTLRDWVERVIEAPLYFLSPHLLILIGLFPAMIPALARRLPDDDPAHGPDRLIIDATGIGLAILAVATAFGLVGDEPVQWIGPLVLMVSTWATGRARRAARHPWQIRALVALGLALATFAFGLRLANMYWQQPVCKICRWGVPYDALAARLAAEKPAAILALDAEAGGNLVRFFPAIPVVDGATATAALPRPLVVLWRGRKSADLPDLPARLRDAAAGHPATPITLPWPAGIVARVGRATSVWYSVTLP